MRVGSACAVPPCALATSGCRVSPSSIHKLWHDALNASAHIAGAHKVARLEVTGLPFDHAERVPMHPAARGSIPVLRRSAASSAGTSPPAGQPRAGAAPQHPAGRSPAAAAMAAARQAEAPGAAEGAGHEAGDGHVARRHGGRQIMAAFDALDAELEQVRITMALTTALRPQLNYQGQPCCAPAPLCAPANACVVYCRSSQMPQLPYRRSMLRT